MAAQTAPLPQRLVSLDAYRGFIMLAMASGGFAFAKLANDPEILSRYAGTQYDASWRQLWSFLGVQFEHVPWIGCVFWDLIQPSFMFMVGVALPYSLARRSADGQAWFRTAWHVIWRAAVLILLGVFLSSNWSEQTNFTFVNVLTQIGLGYPFVALLVGRGKTLQALAIALILGGYWYLFYQFPVPGPGFSKEAVGLPDDWHMLTGIAGHWNKNANYAHWVDVEYIMNWFPRSEPFAYNNGGYQTLNFIPSMATMLFGVMAGEMLRGSQKPNQKVVRLLLAGAACLVIGVAVDGLSWPFIPQNWSLCPIVKRIWTPSWAVYSTGWTLWMLAAFYWVFDVQGWRWLAFPLVVVGMNSIAMYCMSQLLKPWISQTLKIHLGSDIFAGQIGSWIYDPSFGPMFEAIARLLVMWLICLWMYRQKIFIRI